MEPTMNIRGLIFDINGTLTDIHTDESYEDIYRVLSNFLSYQGIIIDPSTVKDLYFSGMKEQLRTSAERYPEFDAVTIFREIVTSHASDYTLGLPAERLAQLPRILAEVYRSVSRFKLQLYPGVEEIVGRLHQKYRMAALSDGQSAWAVPELYAVGLLKYFSPVVVSGDVGYRKPDRRIFEGVLSAMGLSASEVLFVGNNMYRDVFGAKQVGVKTVYFRANGLEERTQGEGGDVRADYDIRDFSQVLDAVSFFERQ
jgi:putative hydrolase of the HAD superfamily